MNVRRFHLVYGKLRRLGLSTWFAFFRTFFRVSLPAIETKGWGFSCCCCCVSCVSGCLWLSGGSVVPSITCHGYISFTRFELGEDGSASARSCQRKHKVWENEICFTIFYCPVENWNMDHWLATMLGICIHGLISKSRSCNNGTNNSMSRSCSCRIVLAAGKREHVLVLMGRKGFWNIIFLFLCLQMNKVSQFLVGLPTLFKTFQRTSVSRVK